MKIIFYFTGIIFAIVEIFRFTKLDDWIKRLVDYNIWKRDTKEDKDAQKWDNMPEEHKNLTIQLIFIYLPALLWFLLGLFTYNWEFFLIYLLTSFTLGRLLVGSKYEMSGWKVFYSGLWKIIAIIFYVFVALNSYHLHIQLGLTEFIKNLF